MEYANAMSQVGRIKAFVNVEKNLRQPPVSMPQERIRAAGIEPELWCGLGIVGLWAAIDAFGERIIGTPGGGLSRFAKRAPAHTQVLEELDDLRSLFAHNFAGIADRTYLSHSQRKCLKPSKPYLFSCGLRFGGNEGERVVLTLDHLTYYATQAEQILAALQ